MDCAFHAGVDSVDVCESCGRPLCSRCVSVVGGRTLCPDCVSMEERKRTPVVIDYGRAFSYVIDDPGWIKKVVIGGLFVLASVVIVPIFFLLGYQLRVIRRVMAGDDRVLPRWEGMKDIFTRGARLFAVMFCYAIPGIALFAGFTVIGVTIEPADVIYRVSEKGASALFCFLFVAFILYLLFLNLIRPALVIRFLSTDSIRASLSPRKALNILRANPGPYLVIFLFSTFIIAPLGLLGLVGCGVGVLFSLFYALLVDSHLYAQLYRITPR